MSRHAQDLSIFARRHAALGARVGPYCGGSCVRPRVRRASSGGAIAPVSVREPNPEAGDIFSTGMLLILGFAGFFRFDVTFPIILILLGGVLLIRAFMAQRRSSHA